VPGIHYTASGLIMAILLLGILNAVVRPILVVLALPLLIFTLGLFFFVINALLLYWVGHLLPGDRFSVDTFTSAFWGSLIISFVSFVLESLTRSGNTTVTLRKGKSPPPPPKDDGGPIIDI